MGNEGSQPLKYGETLENDAKVSWKALNKESQFSGREGHCACSVDKSLYSFGGITSAGGELHDTDDLFVYDLEKCGWAEIKCAGITPPSRAGATMAAVNTKLYLFGGLNHQQGWLQDVYVFDTEKETWSVLETSGVVPSPRDKLASAAIGDKIYIFGGFGPQGMEDQVDEDEEDDEEEDDSDGAQFGWFNDLFIFDTATSTWSSPLQMNAGAPSPRAATGMAAVGKHLVIFGGKDAEARKNDLYIFDTETRKWVGDLDKVISGRQPEPRSFHTLTTIGPRVVVTGGRGVSNQHFDDFHIFDTESKQWLQPAVEGERPAARGAHTATVVGSQLLLCGGSSSFNPETGCCDRFYNDLYSINTGDVESGKVIPKASVDDKENVASTANTSAAADSPPLKPRPEQPSATMDTV